MGKLREFNIEFDKHKEIYDSGEMISGNVCLNLAEDKCLRGKLNMIFQFLTVQNIFFRICVICIYLYRL